jgi:hypothetical protein
MRQRRTSRTLSAYGGPKKGGFLSCWKRFGYNLRVLLAKVLRCLIIY